MTIKLFSYIFLFLVNKSLNVTGFFFLFFQRLLLVVDQAVRIRVAIFVVGSCISKILEQHMSEDKSNFTSPT
jgi:hypothetical protein